MTPQPARLEIKCLSDIVSPFLMQNKPVSCVVAENGTSIFYKDSNRKTAYELVEPHPQGTEITLDVTGFFKVVATLASEDAQYQMVIQKEDEFRFERERQEAEKARIEDDARARVFNQALNLPFRWVPDVKVVLSGLYATGDGMNRRSVFHVRVLEAYEDGRFLRGAGDFLCGKDKSVYQGYGTPGESSENVRQVTCKQCIKVAKRFQSD